MYIRFPFSRPDSWIVVPVEVERRIRNNRKHGEKDMRKERFRVRGALALKRSNTRQANKGIDWLPLRCSFKGKRTNCLLVCIRNRDGLKVNIRRPRHNYFITMKCVSFRYNFFLLSPSLVLVFGFGTTCSLLLLLFAFKSTDEYLLGCTNIERRNRVIKSNEPIMIVILWLTEYALPIYRFR